MVVVIVVVVLLEMGMGTGMGMGMPKGEMTMAMAQLMEIHHNRNRIRMHPIKTTIKSKIIMQTTTLHHHRRIQKLPCHLHASRQPTLPTSSTTIPTLHLPTLMQIPIPKPTLKRHSSISPPKED